MSRIWLLVMILLVTLFNMNAYAHEGVSHFASAVLKDPGGREVGRADFTEDGSGLVRLEVTASGLPPGDHGIHVHEKGDCTPPFAAAGAHYDPLGKKHGLDNPEGPHAGDLPNLRVDDNGDGFLSVTTARFSLSPGPTTLLDGDGSSLVVHAGPDDQATDPAGNSGDRIACGVVQAK